MPSASLLSLSLSLRRVLVWGAPLLAPAALGLAWGATPDRWLPLAAVVAGLVALGQLPSAAPQLVARGGLGALAGLSWLDALALARTEGSALEALVPLLFALPLLVDGTRPLIATHGSLARGHERTLASSTQLVAIVSATFAIGATVVPASGPWGTLAGFALAGVGLAVGLWQQRLWAVLAVGFAELFTLSLVSAACACGGLAVGLPLVVIGAVRGLRLAWLLWACGGDPDHRRTMPWAYDAIGTGAMWAAAVAPLLRWSLG